MSDVIDIRELRKSRNWSQGELADYLGLDRSTVSRMENGQAPKGPTRRLLEALAAQPAPPAAPAAAAPGPVSPTLSPSLDETLAAAGHESPAAALSTPAT